MRIKKLTVQKKAIIALCFAALSFVMLNVATRMMSEGFGTFTQVYLRIGGGFLLALILFHKSVHFSKRKHISRKDWMMLLIMGTIGYGIAVIFITLSILNTTLLNVAVISSTVPFFVLLYLVLFTQKKVSLVCFGFLLISFLGVYFIATKSFSLVDTGFGVGELYALLFAVGTGAFVVARRYISNNLSNPEITLIVMAIAFISSLIIAVLFGEELTLSGFMQPVALLGFILGSVLNVSATHLQNFGFQQLHPVVGSQLLLLQNIFAPILGVLLYSETILPIEFVGALLILAGVFGYYKKAEN